MKETRDKIERDMRIRINMYISDPSHKAPEWKMQKNISDLSGKCE